MMPKRKGINIIDSNIKDGDTVVCVNAIGFTLTNNGNRIRLTLYKKYQVIKKSQRTITIIDDSNNQYAYSILRFIKLSDYRKQKLEKIFK